MKNYTRGEVTQNFAWLNSWMKGRMIYRWKDRCTSGRKGGRNDRWIYRCISGWTGGRKDDWSYGRKDGWTNGRTGGWNNELTDERKAIPTFPQEWLVNGTPHPANRFDLIYPSVDCSVSCRQVPAVHYGGCDGKHRGNGLHHPRQYELSHHSRHVGLGETRLYGDPAQSAAHKASRERQDTAGLFFFWIITISGVYYCVVGLSLRQGWVTSRFTRSRKVYT